MWLAASEVWRSLAALADIREGSTPTLWPPERVDANQAPSWITSVNRQTDIQLDRYIDRQKRRQQSTCRNHIAYECKKMFDWPKRIEEWVAAVGVAMFYVEWRDVTWRGRLLPLAHRADHSSSGSIERAVPRKPGWSICMEWEWVKCQPIQSPHPIPTHTAHHITAHHSKSNHNVTQVSLV